jgi:Ca2+-dependent lipid-binding protein
VSGTNLVAKDAGGTSDPYVKVGFLDSKKNDMFKAEGTTVSFKTDVVKKTLGPNWNYKGELQVGPMVVQNCKELLFMVYVCVLLLDQKNFSLLLY